MNKLPLYALVAVAPLLSAATVSSGHLYGYYKDGIYTAPGKLFRVSSPFPDEPTVSDGREPANNNAGALSFIDSAGRLLGVLYMDNKGAGSGADADAAKQIGSWFRDTGFPGFFRVSVPDAKILREAPGEIAGQPAWIAVAYLPNSSPLGLNVRNSYEVIRNDSWRGMAVVAAGFGVEAFGLAVAFARSASRRASSASFSFSASSASRRASSSSFAFISASASICSCTAGSVVAAVSGVCLLPQAASANATSPIENSDSVLLEIISKISLILGVL